MRLPDSLISQIRPKATALYLTGCAIITLFAAGCSSLNLESAKNIGAAGKESTVLSIGSIFVSHDEYVRAMNADAFLHGYAGTAIPEQLHNDYQAIRKELDSRKLVFSKLGQVYEAFYTLAAYNSAGGVETAINDLGDAVNGYAVTLNKKAALSKSEKDSIASIGGLVATRIQKRRVVKASMLIRNRLEELARLLADPLVKTQITSFNKSLTASRSAAITMLWEKGLLDPTPLITELGSDAGLKASKDALKIIAAPGGSNFNEGLGLVVKARMDRRADLIEQGYDATTKIISELIATHEKLEKGDELSPAQLRSIIIELQLITDLLTPQTAK